MEQQSQEVLSFSQTKIVKAKYDEEFKQTTLTQCFRAMAPNRGSTGVINHPSTQIKQVTPTVMKKKNPRVAATDVVQHSDIQDESQFDITRFTFDDLCVGNEYEVVINEDGETVPIQAPTIEYFNSPKQGFNSHHVYFNCEFPPNIGSTWIPSPGMYDYHFTKRYIKHEHSLLNGKINAWRIETLKVLFKVFEKMKVVEELAICEQEHYARERVAVVQQNIHDFEYCCISLLNEDGINKVVLHGSGYHDDANLISMMMKFDNFELIVKPGDDRYNFDLITRFNHDENLDFAFGKPKVDEGKKRKLYRGSVKEY